jgi:uncharacterized protein involved in response to NO
MTWWALVLGGVIDGFPAPAHAIVMLWLVMPALVMGFSMTAMPRWLGVEPIRPGRYGLVGALLTLASVVGLIALFGSDHDLLELALTVQLAAWSLGVLWLGLVAHAERDVHRRTTLHGVALIAANVIGVVSLAVATYGPPGRTLDAIDLATWGFLVPTFLTVSHRMVPFFAGRETGGGPAWRATWTLAALWLLLLIRLAVTCAGGATWPVDAALSGLSAFLLWRWWPRGADHRLPGLLVVLLIGVAWFPLAMLLLTLTDLSGGRVELNAHHALYAGFCGSVVVAMVTRVTQGHSGRPLVLPAVAVLAFAGVQVAAVLRVLLPLGAPPVRLYAIPALIWVLATLPWAARALWISSRPRTDGQPG